MFQEENDDEESAYNDYIGDNPLIDETAKGERENLKKKKDQDADNVDENEGGENDEE